MIFDQRRLELREEIQQGGMLRTRMRCLNVFNPSFKLNVNGARVFASTDVIWLLSSSSLNLPHSEKHSHRLAMFCITAEIKGI
jgi:hypothetical protein